MTVKNKHRWPDIAAISKCIETAEGSSIMKRMAVLKLNNALAVFGTAQSPYAKEIANHHLLSELVSATKKLDASHNVSKHTDCDDACVRSECSNDCVIQSLESQMLQTQHAIKDLLDAYTNLSEQTQNMQNQQCTTDKQLAQHRQQTCTAFDGLIDSHQTNMKSNMQSEAKLDLHREQTSTSLKRLIDSQASNVKALTESKKQLHSHEKNTSIALDTLIESQLSIKNDAALRQSRIDSHEKNTSLALDKLIESQLSVANDAALSQSRIDSHEKKTIDTFNKLIKSQEVANATAQLMHANTQTHNAHITKSLSQLLIAQEESAASAKCLQEQMNTYKNDTKVRIKQLVNNKKSKQRMKSKKPTVTLKQQDTTEVVPLTHHEFLNASNPSQQQSTPSDVTPSIAADESDCTSNDLASMDCMMDVLTEMQSTVNSNKNVRIKFRKLNATMKPCRDYISSCKQHPENINALDTEHYHNLTEAAVHDAQQLVEDHFEEQMLEMTSKINQDLDAAEELFDYRNSQ